MSFLAKSGIYLFKIHSSLKIYCNCPGSVLFGLILILIYLILKGSYRHFILDKGRISTEVKLYTVLRFQLLKNHNTNTKYVHII